jgi:hypothetical protein
MGGFGGGNSTGGGGGVGPAGRKSDGSYGTARDASRASNRNEGRKAVNTAVNFVKRGGITGAVVRGISSAVKNRNKTASKTRFGYSKPKTKTVTSNTTRGDNDGSNRVTAAKKAQGIELAKKIEKQTISDNQLVKRTQAEAKGQAPKGPTAVEMAQNEEDAEAKRLLRIKRKGRKTTILNVPKEELTLSTKQLLG